IFESLPSNKHQHSSSRTGQKTYQIPFCALVYRLWNSLLSLRLAMNNLRQSKVFSGLGGSVQKFRRAIANARPILHWFPVGTIETQGFISIANPNTCKPLVKEFW
ncbi:MAG: hypothetical protein KGK08_14340, partial [Acidobacteriota bacterium]|nr:hypothetical protein [Acidobacteriota bacterium]